MSNRQVLNHFGLNRLGTYRGENFQKAVGEIIDAINDNEMLAICGDPGTGKSTVFAEAVQCLRHNPDRAPIFVKVNDWFRERLTIANIMNAIIEDLSREGPKRCLEARSRQCERILGEKAVSEHRKIVVVLEQGHRLHLNTLIALKELREATFAGHDRLCSVILLGHPELRAKIARRNEIALRTEFLMLDEAHGWMTFKERVKYIEAVYGEAITEKARERIAFRKKTPLEIYYYLKEKMREEMQAGYDIIDEKAVEPTLFERKSDLKVSYNEIAKEANISKTAVSNAFQGEAEHLIPTVIAAMERLQEKQINETIRRA